MALLNPEWFIKFTGTPRKIDSFNKSILLIMCIFFYKKNIELKNRLHKNSISEGKEWKWMYFRDSISNSLSPTTKYPIILNLINHHRKQFLNSKDLAAFISEGGKKEASKLCMDTCFFG